jgi:hypothetical protein
MKWNKQNIVKGIATTLAGVALMGLGGYLILKSIYADTTEQIAMLVGQGVGIIGTGLYLLGVDDPKLPRKGAGMAVCALLLLSSCASWERCAKKFGTGETHTITVRDTVRVEIPVPLLPDSVSGTVPCELQGDTVVHVSESGELQIAFWRNQYTKALQYKATVKPDTIYVEKQVPVMVQAECPNAVVAKPAAPGWRERVWKDFQFFSAWLVLAVGVVLVLRKLVA